MDRQNASGKTAYHDFLPHFAAPPKRSGSPLISSTRNLLSDRKHCWKAVRILDILMARNCQVEVISILEDDPQEEKTSWFLQDLSLQEHILGCSHAEHAPGSPLQVVGAATPKYKNAGCS